MRRLLPALVIACSVLPVATPARAQPAPVPVVVIDGKGFGHGVGMAQEGAFWMASAGASTEQILGQFYPGAGLGRARGPVRVPVLDAGPAPAAGVLAFPDGGEVRENGTGAASPGFPVRVRAGGQVRIVLADGRYRVETADAVAMGSPPPSSRRVELASGVRPQIPTLPPPPASTTTTAPATTTTAAPLPAPAPPSSTTTTTSPPPADGTTPPAPAPAPGQDPAPPGGGGDGSGGSGGSGGAPTSARPLVAVASNNGTVALPARQRRYRGVVEATAASGTLRFVNTVDVESYLKGMGEVRDPSWPAAALRAQAIAARTYAMRAMAVGGEVCDTERCQVYLGAQAEYGAMNKAVDDSREQVLVYNRALISAVYSANGGGFSASREEGFGVADGGVPYLRPAPYPTKDPGPWTVTVALTDVAARLGYRGTLTDVRVGRTGPSGRALEVVLDGSDGPKPVPGIAFDAALGLRSTLFTLRVDLGVAPPPPPAEDLALQAPPEDAAAAVEAALAETPPASTPTPTTAPPIISSPRDLGQVPVEAAIFGGWIVFAAVGGAVVGLRRSPPRPSTPPPSPSAPPSGDGSP